MREKKKEKEEEKGGGNTRHFIYWTKLLETSSFKLISGQKFQPAEIKGPITTHNKHRS